MFSTKLSTKKKVCVSLLQLSFFTGLTVLAFDQFSFSTTNSITALLGLSPSQNSFAFAQNATHDKVVDDFKRKNKNQDRVNALGGYWYTAAGAGSEVSPTPNNFKLSDEGVNGKGKSAKLTGKVTKGGYISIGTSLSKNGQPISLAQYKGIEFWAKGDGKKYGIQLQTPNVIKDYNYYSYVFVAKPQWTHYQIPFDKLTQQNWGKKTVHVALKDSLKQVLTITWYPHPYGEPRGSVNLAVGDIKLIY